MNNLIQVNQSEIMKDLIRAREKLIENGICTKEGSGDEDVEKILAYLWGFLNGKLIITDTHVGR